MDKYIIDEKLIIKDIMNVILNIKKCHSKSTYNILISDLIKLYDLSSLLEINHIPDIDSYSFKAYDFNASKILKPQRDYYRSNKKYNLELVDEYLYLLSNSNNRSYNEPYSKIDINTSIDISRDFFNEFNKNILTELKLLESNKKIMFLNENFDIEEEGITIYGKGFSPYILVKNNDDIFTSRTLIHEVGHVYDFKKSNNKEKNNYTREIYAHFLELVYSDFLKKNKMEYKLVRSDYLDCLQEVLESFELLLNEPIENKIEFHKYHQRIHIMFEYTYGMIFGLLFYDNYKLDEEKGLKDINYFLENRNSYEEPFEILNILDSDKKELLKGKVLKKHLKQSWM